MPKASRWCECEDCHGLGIAYYLSIPNGDGTIHNKRVCQTCWKKATKQPTEEAKP